MHRPPDARERPRTSPAGRAFVSTRGRALTAAILASAALGCSAGKGDRERDRDARLDSAADSVASAARPSWYQRVRALDLTGDGTADTVRLDAVGTRPDSLRITLVLIVDRAVRHREAWGSSYELALVDAARRSGPEVMAVVRAQLDTVLSSVRVQRLDAPGVRLVAEDSAILGGLEPRATHRISFAYGYETTVHLVWDAPRQRFVRLWSCC